MSSFMDIELWLTSTKKDYVNVEQQWMQKTLSFGASARNAKLVCLYPRSKYMTAIILELLMIGCMTAKLRRGNGNDRPMD
jgi:hypothetical protein